MDKRIKLDDIVSAISSGSFVAFGGGGLQRKPMTVTKAIARSDISGLDVFAFLGGPEVDLLLGVGKIASLHFSFIGFDSFGLAPNFRKARETAGLKAFEYSEGTAIAGVEAGAKRIPFMPTRYGLGTDLLRTPTTKMRTFACPVSGETLVAVPAIRPDIAIIHVNEADRGGNGLILGDPFIDPLLSRAATKVFLTAERIVDSIIPSSRTGRATVIPRFSVTGVCEAPGGAGFTGMFPDYPFNAGATGNYLKNANDNAWLRNFAAN